MTTIQLTQEQHELLVLAVSALKGSLNDRKMAPLSTPIEEARLNIAGQIFVSLAANTKANPIETEKLAAMACNAANTFICTYLSVNSR